MIATLRLFRSRQLKYFKLTQKNSGFTLIELLVAMIMAILVLGPLMGFAINIMNTDRQEQAKATSEQEIQSALDYIAQDLEQAVYIYDDYALNNSSTTDPTTSGIKDQIPPVDSAAGCGDTTTTTCIPVLVFWKREFKQQAVLVNTSIPNQKNDIFVYALVAYYLIKDNNYSSSSWSQAARIGRFEIKDGVRNPNDFNSYINENDPNIGRSPGFKLFNLNLPGTINQKMNMWTNNSSEKYTATTDVLIDYVDQSPTMPGFLQPVDCTKALTPDPTQPNQQARLVPSSSVNTVGIYSFYACVDNSKNLAQIYIRGNALARITTPVATYSNSPYFPTTSIQIKGRGFLGRN